MEISTRSDLGIARRALEERWPIDAALRGDLIQSVLGVITHPKSTLREQLSGVRVILAMDRINIEQLKLSAVHDDGHDLDARLAVAEQRAAALDAEGAVPSVADGVP